MLVTEFCPRLIYFLEGRAFVRELLVELLGRLVAGLQDGFWKGAQLGAAGHQPPQRHRVADVVLGGGPLVGFGGSHLERRFVFLRQGSPGLGVDKHHQGCRALPPAGKVVILGDLVQTQTLIVKGADKFSRVQHAFFERRVNVACGQLLGHDTKFGQHHARQTADAELQALQVGH